MKISKTKEEIKNDLRDNCHIIVDKFDDADCLCCCFNYQSEKYVFRIDFFEEDVSEEENSILREAILELWEELKVMDLTIYFSRAWKEFHKSEEYEIWFEF